jgi:NitT/TauT family transport system ATP-binding protein
MTVLLVTHDIDESVYMADVVQVLSKRPTRLIETVATGLPRPRDQITTKALPDYVRLRGHVTALIRNNGFAGAAAARSG